MPYKGSAGAITDLLGGQVNAMILPVGAALTHAKGGRIRLLAVTRESRLPAIADVPTLAEQGVRGAETDLWFGLFAPARTPPAVVERLNAEVNRILAQPDVVEELEKQGLAVTPGRADVLGKLVQDDGARWADVIKRAGIQAD